MIARGSDDITIDWRFKGFPVLPAGTTVAQFVTGKPSLFEAGFSWPVMALRESAVSNNVEVLARWCASAGLSLAPHGKTTMAPALFERQIAAGAWGITAATPWHVRVYREFGIRRVLLANELVDTTFAPWLAAQLDDPAFDFYCYVDSVEGAARLAAIAVRASRPIQVLLEIGIDGGRTGVRTETQCSEVASAVASSDRLSLVGVAGYEGPLGHGRDEATRAAVRSYVGWLGSMLEKVDHAGLLDQQASEYILTCGGSGHVDVVSDELARPRHLSRPLRPVLRSGAYITFDEGLYGETSSLAAALRPALEVWCQVLSRPEPRLALLDAGRRDLPGDAGMPVPRLRRAQTGIIAPLTGQVTKLNDQHAYLELEPSAQLEVGDLVCLGISHPCTAHDKWQLVPLLDDEWRVIDCIRSYF